MAKRYAVEHGSGKKIPIETDPVLKAVIGTNVYMPDGVTLLDLNTFIDSTTTTIDVPVTTTDANGVTTTTTQKKVLGRLPAPVSQSSIPFILPATTKGDLMIHDGTKVVRFPVGPPGSVLTADPSTATGERWAPLSSLAGLFPSMLAMDGLDGMDSFIPGPQGTVGTAGATGATGPTGAAGASAQATLVFDGADGLDAFAMPSTALGDISGQVGSIVKVTGFAGTPLNTLPSVSGQIWIYRAGTNIWNALSMSGDVTMTFVGATTIQPNVVDNTKLAQMPANTIKLNNTPATANAIDGTPAQLAQMLSGLMPTTMPMDGNDGQDAFALPTPTQGIVGRFLKRTVVVAGTTFQVSGETNKIFVEIWGGGGGGAGCATGVGQSAAGGGGGAGGYACRVQTATPNQTFTIALGAAGAAGTNAPGAGGTGGNTTFSGASTLTANGGVGGSIMVAGSAVLFAQGGAGGTASNGDLQSQGSSGGCGIRLSATIAASGAGGDSTLGNAGGALASAGNGTTPGGSGNGAGGSGGLMLNGSAAVTGGAGGPGIIIVWEFS